MDKQYEIMNLYWRGGENDIETPVEVLKTKLKTMYEEMFGEFYKAIGYRVPVTLNKILCREIMAQRDPSGEYLKSMNYINEMFEDLSKEHRNISMFDSRNAPFYKENKSGNGLFISDLVHYTPETNWWNAKRILEDYIYKNINY